MLCTLYCGFVKQTRQKLSAEQAGSSGNLMNVAAAHCATGSEQTVATFASMFDTVAKVLGLAIDLSDTHLGIVKLSNSKKSYTGNQRGPRGVFASRQPQPEGL